MKKEIKGTTPIDKRDPNSILIDGVYNKSIEAYLWELQFNLRNVKIQLAMSDMLGTDCSPEMLSYWQEAAANTPKIIREIAPKDRCGVLAHIGSCKVSYDEIGGIEGKEYNPKEFTSVSVGRYGKIENITPDDIYISEQGETTIIHEPERGRKLWIKTFKAMRKVMGLWEWYTNPSRNLSDEQLKRVFEQLKEKGYIEGRWSAFKAMYQGAEIPKKLQPNPRSKASKPRSCLRWIAPNKTYIISYNYKALVELLIELMGATTSDCKTIFSRYFGLEYRADFYRKGEDVSIHYANIREIASVRYDEISNSTTLWG